MWCIFAKARRKDQLKKIAKDAADQGNDSNAFSMVGGIVPIALPLTGGSRFVSRFDGNIPVFGPVPATVPPREHRPPAGSKEGAQIRDQAFESPVREPRSKRL